MESKRGLGVLSGDKMKRRGREASVHSREEDTGESSVKTKKRHKKADKTCSSLSEDDSGEPRLKKRRYKKSDKRCTIS